MQKIQLKINDMHCAACVLRLESIEDDLDGVTSARANYVKQTMEVTYDEHKLDPSRILTAIQEIGYHPEPM